jgi:hypothetical protein
MGNQCNIFGGEATNDKDMVFENQKAILHEPNVRDKNDVQSSTVYKSANQQDDEKNQYNQNKELTFNNNNNTNKLENYLSNDDNANQVEVQQDDQIDNNNRDENCKNHENNKNSNNPDPNIEDGQNNGDGHENITQENENNDNNDAAILQDDQVVKDVVDEVANQNNNEEHETNESFEFVQESTVVLNNKKVQDFFNPKHPLLNQNLDNFKIGFSKKLNRFLVKAD